MSEQVLQLILGEVKEMRSEQRQFATKLDSFETKLDSFETKLGSFETKLGSFETKLGSFETKLGSFEITQNSLVAGQKELNQVVGAIIINQETTNAKLDALTMDVRRLEGNTHRIERKLDEQSAVIRGDLRFLNHRVADLEMDVAEIKNR